MGGSSSGHLSVCVLAAVLAFACGGAAASAKEKVLYNFRGGSDGYAPWAQLIADGSGNLYGTTAGGGGGTGCKSVGCGTVFQIASDGTETVLHAFAGGCD